MRPIGEFMLAHGLGALHLTTGEEIVQRDYVDVTIRCRCGYDWRSLCVPIDMRVPPQLRCNPGGSPIAGPSMGRSDICCTQCLYTLFPSDPALRSRVEDELRRGRGLHVQEGTVLIDCR